MAVIALIYERPGFHINTPFSLRGSGGFDATEAGEDLGNVSGAAAIPGYMCQPGREPAWPSTSTLIWVKRSLIRVFQSLGNATASGTHSAAQLLPVGMETPWTSPLSKL